jgi:hypothetical protein
VGPKTLLAVLLVLCSAPSLAACGPDGGSPSSGGEERASAPAPTTQGQERPTTRERPTAQEQTREKQPPPEQARPEETRSELEELLDEPARAPEPAYATVGDGTGALSLQVPAAWGKVIVGQESEGGGGSWTTFGGAGVASSITAAPDLAAWHETVGAVGTYAVASRTLARRYTDDELVALGPNDFSAECVPGARSGFSRPPYSGVAQAWKGCGGDPAASYVTLSAAPEGRECVVVMHIGLVVGEEGLEAGQHLLETFEADCTLVPAEAEVEASASSAEAYAYETSEPTEAPQYGAGVACSDFVAMYGEPSQWQAQRFYDGVATPEQRAALDPDGDGFACSEGNR